MLGQPPDQSLVMCEFLSLFAVLLYALVFAKPGRSHLRGLKSRIDAIARRQRLACLCVGLVAVSMSVALAAFTFFPEPAVHDEFSFLLSADTLAHGRLTNPTHPLWQHFESFHVIHEPSYASKYPPAQGLFLAAGQLIAGHPIFGVWLSLGLACAALCWMLQAYVPARWAFYGGLLAAVHRGIVSQWSHCYSGGAYWGGCVPMLGGALVFGALKRMWVRPTIGNSLVLATGVVLLANSRPFEGFIASVPAGLAILYWMTRRQSPGWKTVGLRVALPMLLVLATGAFTMSYYNIRVTGSATTMPYQVHEETYAETPLFLWEPVKSERVYRHEPLRQMHAIWERGWYDRQQTFDGFLNEVLLLKLDRTFKFYFGITLSLLLVGLPWSLGNRWTRFALVVVGSLFLACCVSTYFQPHYAAPVTALMFLLLVQSMRWLRAYRLNERPVGRALVQGAVAIYVVCFAVSCWNRYEYYARLTDLDDERVWSTLTVPEKTGHALRVRLSLLRAKIIADLSRTGERNLVIVRQKPWFHPVDFEFVFNEADIDSSAVVWAREMGSNEDRKLLDYFRERKVWLLQADAVVPRLVPYELPSAVKGESGAVQAGQTVPGEFRKT